MPQFAILHTMIDNNRIFPSRPTAPTVDRQYYLTASLGVLSAHFLEVFRQSVLRFKRHSMAVLPEDEQS